MRALFFFIACSAFLMCVEYVSEIHSNGMPKVIKTYNGYGKLELTKESGYYSDGVKQYEKSYYNGQAKNTIRWDRNGKRLAASQNSINQKSDWPSSVKAEMLADCVADGMTEKVCQCVLDATTSEFTYSEFQDLENASPDDSVNEEMQERAMALMMAVMECSL